MRAVRDYFEQFIDTTDAADRLRWLGRVKIAVNVSLRQLQQGAFIVSGGAYRVPWAHSSQAKFQALKF